MAKDKNYTVGVIFSLINCFSLGILGIVDKVGILNSNNPLLFSTQSLLFALSFTLLFALIYFKGFPASNLKLPPKYWLLMILIGIFGSGLFVFLRLLGLTQSTGTFATLSQIVTTSLTALLAFVFLKERLSKSFWLLFLIIIFSMYLVSIGRIAFADVKTGDLIIICGTFFLAFSNIFSKIAVGKINPILLSAGRLFFGFIFLLIVNFILGGNLFKLSNYWVILSGFLMATGVIGFNLAIKRLGITFATSILMTAPIITMVLEYLLLNYHFTIVQEIAAIGVVFAGIALVLANRKPKST